MCIIKEKVGNLVIWEFSTLIDDSFYFDILHQVLLINVPGELVNSYYS